MQMFGVRQMAFEIIEQIGRSDDLQSICSVLLRHGSTFGYEAFTLGYVPRSSQQTARDCIIISGWPPAWARRYQARNHIRTDPVLTYMRQVVDPFTWQEAADAIASPSSRVVMDEARAFQLRDGFCVPFHQPDGNEAGISFGGERMRLSQDERAALHLVAIYAVSVARAIARSTVESGVRSRVGAALTDREIECLKWVSAGKTAWETSVILSISRRTVEQHLGSAAKKLNAVGRVQSVAEAIRLGIIS
jgi:LuxR family transcriptional regulator, quorum-sensing system regulator BjaR1